MYKLLYYRFLTRQYYLSTYIREGEGGVSRFPKIGQFYMGIRYALKYFFGPIIPRAACSGFI